MLLYLGGGDYITKIFMICNSYQLLFVLSHQEKRSTRHVLEWQRGEVHSVLAGRHKVKTSLARPSYRQHEVKMDLQEVR